MGSVYGSTARRLTSWGARLAIIAAVLPLALMTFGSMSYAQSESVVNAFNCLTELSTGCQPGDADPGDGDLIVKDGVLYGLTTSGGLYGAGLLYALKPPSTPAGAWSKTVLYDFGHSDGVLYPTSLLAGPRKTLYAASPIGGATGNAEVFSLEPPANGGVPWVLTVLYSFAGGLGENAWGLTLDSNGTLYGVNGGGLQNWGDVFSLTPPATPGGAWTENVIYSVLGANGIGPVCGPLLGQNGVLYGMTGAGGKGWGFVYALTPPATRDESWTESTLYSFQGLTAGGLAGVTGGRLVKDKNGHLFGTIQDGSGYLQPGTFGAAFELIPPSRAGGAWTERTLWVFGVEPGDGELPNGLTLVNDSLYGTTFAVGPSDNGIVFQLTPPTALDSPWTENIVHSFSANGTDGYTPNSSLSLGPNGLLYGTTSSGTIYGGQNSLYSGTVFEVTP